MNKFKELKVWQEAIELAAEIYSITEQFPSKETYGLVSQINRSAISIASNIAEGAGRNSNKEFNQFLGIALGSLYELETQLIIGNRIGYLTSETNEQLLTRITTISKMLTRLKQSLLK